MAYAHPTLTSLLPLIFAPFPVTVVGNCTPFTNTFKILLPKVNPTFVQTLVPILTPSILP